MKKYLLAFVGLLWAAGAQAQGVTCPYLQFGNVLTAQQWQFCFGLAQANLGYVPVNRSGDVMQGYLIMAPSTTGGAGINLPPGVAPSSPHNGDMWMTSAGMFAQVNGQTVGPYLASGGTSLQNPGTGLLEMVLPSQNFYSVTSHTYSTNDMFKVTRRSNFGSAMTDTFPTQGALGMTNGTRISVWNEDTAASITITAGTGTHFYNGGATTTIAPQRQVDFVYSPLGDNAAPKAWFAIGNSDTGLVGSFQTPQQRLTLTTGTPVLTGAVTASGTVFYTPYEGSQVPLWTGNLFALIPCGETSNILANSSTGSAGPAAAVASSVYDLFIWYNNGVCTLTRGPAWTNNTTRSAGTVLTRVNGGLVNSVAITNGPAIGFGTYVGTIATDGGGATVSFNPGGVAAGGTAGVVGVWNMYRRVLLSTASSNSTQAYTQTAGTIRQVDSSAGMQTTLVTGQQEDYAQALFDTNGENSVAASFMAIGIGLDSTTAFTSPSTMQAQQNTAAQYQPLHTMLNVQLLGKHVLSANQEAIGNTGTWNNAINETLVVQMRY